MRVEEIEMMGMVVDKWDHKSCVATVGKGENWATIYSINSEEEGKGHATELLRFMKGHYTTQGRKFGSSVALNDRMKHLLVKLEIFEYAE